MNGKRKIRITTLVRNNGNKKSKKNFIKEIRLKI